MSNSVDKENTLQPESKENTSYSGSTTNTNPDFQPPLPNFAKSPFLNKQTSNSSNKFRHYLDHEHRASNPIPHRPTFTEYIISKLPIIDTFETYNTKLLLSDISAGLTIGVQLLPKGMAYAMMAGLSKSNGVIVAMMCTLLYPLCGSTPYLCTGPDPIICLLISNAIQSLYFGN
eukprot:262684_1